MIENWYAQPGRTVRRASEAQVEFSEFEVRAP
ncbi:hypothetical protein TFLX_05272 [Thermoflexales bacterium]|nr:hypothetical protein TFLX_05272 [Thermoflexales bacterium]